MRVVFPVTDASELPLYLDAQDWTSQWVAAGEAERLARARSLVDTAPDRRPLRLTDRDVWSWVTSRRSLTVPAGSVVSLASYFNAFPASYWMTWTNLSAVELRVRTTGSGRLSVYRSNARGIIQEVHTQSLAGSAEYVRLLPLDSFTDGGWYWFDLAGGDGGLTLEHADWMAPAETPALRVSRATVSITTLNRGEYCTALLSSLAADPEVLDVLDEVIVVDQGSERIVDAAGFPAAERGLGAKLRVLEQANLGGSGGFARGMLETLRAGASSHVLLLDDDISLDAESVRRMLRFADHAVTPMLVGGHMLDMYDKAVLHAYAEGVRSREFMWGPYTPYRHRLADSNLRQTPWLHRRFDVDYNGWWMCLIPVEALRDAGLSLPVFIKWDDAEYGLRAREHGYPTVSLPGSAVWHVSWVDKDDTHDWQAFFHARNRLVAALLHSPHRKGGLLVRDNLAQDVKNLLTMNYFTVAARHQAYENVLAGPHQLPQDMVDRLPRIRRLAESYRETTVHREVQPRWRFPAREVPSVKTGTVAVGPTGAAAGLWLVKQVLRHGVAPTNQDPERHPQAHLPYQDARWFVVPDYDSVLVSNADGAGVTWRVRDAKLFRKLLLASFRYALRFRRRWAPLRALYRRETPELISADAWARHLGVPLGSRTADREAGAASAGPGGIAYHS